MTHNFLSTAVTGFAVTVAMSEVAFFFIYRSTRRTRDLKRSKALFEKHFELKDALASQPLLPDSLKQFLDESSQAFMSRAFARIMVEDCDDDKDPEFSNLVEKFHSEQPDLFEDFDRCLRVGLYAMLLRWPETADRANGVMSMVVAAPRQRMVTTVAMRERRTEKSRKEPTPPVGGDLVPAE